MSESPSSTAASTSAHGNRRSPLTWLGLVVLAGLLLLYLMRGGPGRPSQDGPNHPAVGEKLLALSLQPLTGDGQIKNLDGLRGKVTLINYWGTWCYPCRIEMPHLLELARRLADKRDFQFLSVSCGPSTSEDATRLRQSTLDFLARLNVQLTTYSDLDLASRIGLLQSADLRQFVYPTTVVLDDQGVIRGLWLGYADGVVDEMEEVIRASLEPERA